MEPIERGQLTVAIVAQFSGTLRSAIRDRTQDQDEQLEIAGAVIALMLRKMYQQRGSAWLEAILQSVLQPDVRTGTPS